MSNIHFTMDFGRGPAKVVYIVYYGGRAYGKTHFSKLWLQCYHPDLLSQALIRRLAAEAILNVVIYS
jgi:hypothetical protein